MIESDEIIKIMQDVESLSSLLGYPIDSSDYFIEDLGCPHEPSNLKSGYGAVYMFFYNSQALKIGKANANTRNRFKYQHYGFKAPSTLAKSVCADEQFKALGVNQENVRDWLKNNTRRINIQITGKDIEAVTELVEAILHYKFRPRYEGALNNTFGRNRKVNF